MVKSSVDTRNAPLVIVSGDSHIGPPLEVMRPYCPSAYRDEFDQIVANRPRFDIWAETRVALHERLDPAEASHIEHQLDRNLQTRGHFDVDVRLAEMDTDGIAAEVVFHGSQNGEPIPFISSGSGWINPATIDQERAALGMHMYNQWLADACSRRPERFIGIAYLPIWDIDRAISEMKWCREVGLRGVNFPTVRPGIPLYDDPEWRPLWSACEDLDMALNTHVGGAVDLEDFKGPHALALLFAESGGWLSRRALPRMVFSGVFERHPRLKLVLTEQTGRWWTGTMDEFDLIYEANKWQLADILPRRPSEYCARNVFICQSYMAPFEARDAVEGCYLSNLMWGRDYPHAEGTFQYPESADDPNITRLSLRHAMAELSHDEVKALLSENAIRVFGLDGRALTSIAVQIAAPSFKEIAQPLEAIPTGLATQGFRTMNVTR